MSKRSNFERIPRDFYPTPIEAVLPLLPYLPLRMKFGEPCAGNGALVNHLRSFGAICSFACDIEPEANGIAKRDALSIRKGEPALGGVDMFITNPPWPAKYGLGEPTLGLILHLSSILPTWFLLGSDFAFNVYSKKVMKHCSDVVPVGRLKWMPGTKYTGYENCAWYFFQSGEMSCVLHPRLSRSTSREGCNAILIEREVGYVQDIHRRFRIANPSSANLEALLIALL